jgi:hypothetical protein
VIRFVVIRLETDFFSEQKLSITGENVISKQPNPGPFRQKNSISGAAVLLRQANERLSFRWLIPVIRPDNTACHNTP